MYQHLRSPAIRSALAALLGILAGGLGAQKTPDEALRALRQGNRNFVQGQSVPQPLGEGVRRTLARGQTPFAIVVTCADSRVVPEHVFNAGLGELFVVRLAGNTCDPEVLASLEYAVEHLGVPLCVVLGHEDCGVVAAAAQHFAAAAGDPTVGAATPALQQLLERLEPPVRRARARELGGKDLLTACEEENVHHTVHECLRRSPLLRRYVQAGKLRMAPARYRLQSGEVEWLTPRALPAEPGAVETVARHTVPMGVPPHVALRLLQAGHRRFLGDGQPTGDLSPGRREALTHGQRPLAIVLTCADSRVPPEHLFDAGLGELFVVRIAGNTLNDDALASLEYAATHTGASLLVVLGHTRCGAIGAAADLAAAHAEGKADQHTLTPGMRALLARLEPAVEMARAAGARGDALVDLAVRHHVLRTIAEARARSTVVRQLEHDGRLAVLAAVYDVGSGDISWLKEPVEPAPPATPAAETAPTHRADTPRRDPATGGEQAEHHTAPTLDWADPRALAVVSPAHTHPPSDGASHDRPAHGAAAGPTAPAASHDPVDPGAAGGAPPSTPGKPPLDALPLVAAVGIASLLLAALVAATRRR